VVQVDIEEGRKRLTWAAQAACRGMDPDLFFPTDGLMTPEARETCGVCPVRKECLEFGLYEHYGIWGGLTLKDRVRLIKSRRRRERAA
jgi:WhiB family redox-sensing transcriptional regulator